MGLAGGEEEAPPDVVRPAGSAKPLESSSREATKPAATSLDLEEAHPPATAEQRQETPVKRIRRLWWRKRSLRSKTSTGSSDGPTGGESPEEPGE